MKTQRASRRQQGLRAGMAFALLFATSAAGLVPGAGIRESLGVPDPLPADWTSVFSRAPDAPARAEADAPEIRSVDALHLGGRRLLVRVEFDRAPNFRTALFILYVDADNDPGTGRVDHPAHEGVDLMVILGQNRTRLSFHNLSLLPENTRATAALEDRFAYLAIEGPFAEPDREIALRLHGLVEQTGTRGSSFPRTVVRIPASPGAPPPLPAQAERELHPGDYRFRNEQVMYEGAANRGLLRAEVEPAEPISFGRTRPVPRMDAVARRPGEEGRGPGGRIEIRIAEEAGVARTAAPVTAGIPFPEGAVFDLRRLQLLGPDGRAVPAQFTATAYGSDDSLRWVLADWTAHLPAGAEPIFTLVYGDDVRPAAPPEALAVEEMPDGRVVIETGPLSVELDRNRFDLFRAVRLARDGTAVSVADSGGAGVRLEDAQGTVFTTAGRAPESFRVEQRGPHTAVVRVEGRYGTEDGRTFMRYITRLTFRAGSARVMVEHTHINDEFDAEFTDFASLALPLRPAEGLSAVRVPFTDEAGTVRDASGRRLHLFQEDERVGLLRMDGDETSFHAATGALEAQTGSGVITLAVHAFRERWPKGLWADGTTAGVYLLPPLPGPDYGTDLPFHLMFPFVEGRYRLKWGMSFTERVTIDFSGAASAEELAADAAFPPVAVLPAAWYAETGAIEPVAVPRGAQFAGWDAFAADSLDAHLRRKDRMREYGFLNYGDWFGERGRNWGNNEYDTAHGLFMQFLRTGDRRFHRLALATARHQADVDIVHAYPDPFYVGANHQHSIGHTGEWSHRSAQARWSYRYDFHTSAGNGHTWTEGMVGAWLLAGDARVMESALALGEHITWAFVPSFQRLGTHERSAGWSLLAVLALHRATGDPVYRDAAARIARLAMDAQNFDEGGIWPHILPRDHAAGAVDAYGNNVFLIGTLLSGLAAYHEATDDPDAVRSLQAACEWLLRSWDPAAGAWPYSATVEGAPLAGPAPGLNPLIYFPLAYTAQVTGESRFMEVAERSLESAFLFGGSVSFGKDLSMQMIFTPRMLGLLQAWRDARAPDGAERLLDGSDETMRDALRSTPRPTRQSVRAPDRKVFRVRLAQDGAFGLTVERRRHGALPPGAPHGTIRVERADATPAAEGRFSTDDPHTFQATLEGNAGDRFSVVIDDDQRGVWDLSGEGLEIRMETVPGFRIGRPGRAAYRFHVPEGTASFAIRLLGVHEGLYGGAILGPDGALHALHRGANHVGHLLGDLGVEQAGSAAHRFAVTPRPGDTGRDWSLVVWAAGDIGIELDGIPPLLW